jgi:hypothetical protein
MKKSGDLYKLPNKYILTFSENKGNHGNSLTPTKMGSQDMEIKDLKSQLKIVQEQNEQFQNIIKELRETINSLQSKQKFIPPDSDEEERIVEQETGNSEYQWVLAKNKNKKRKANESPEKVEHEPPKKQEVKPIKPPPVVINGVQNYTLLNQDLRKLNVKFTANMLNNEQVKINVSTPDEYRELTKAMNGSKTEWHTYENKQERPIKVMVRHLHHTCKPEDIKEELLDRGFKIQSVVNKLKRTVEKEKVRYTPLPLFMLTFDHTEDIKKIYDINYILNLKVKVEALKINKLIPQCKKCQRFGHTRKFCGNSPKCVKCAGDHITADCDKTQLAKAKCVNCNKAHPASYRGCEVAKELQKRRDALIKPKNNQPRTFTSKMVSTHLPYNQVVQGSSRHQEATLPLNATQTRLNQPGEQTFMQMVQSLITKIEAQNQAINEVSERLNRIEGKYSGAVPRRTT